MKTNKPIKTKEIIKKLNAKKGKAIMDEVDKFPMDIHDYRKFKDEQKNDSPKKKKIKNWILKIISFFKKHIIDFFKRKETPKETLKEISSNFPTKERFYELLNYSENQGFISFDSNSELHENRKKIKEHYSKRVKSVPMMIDFNDIDEHNENKDNNSDSINEVIDKDFYITKRKLDSANGMFNMNRYQSDIHKRKNTLINRNLIKNYLTV